jgi:putative glutamine transport system substrate-binding protein
LGTRGIKWCWLGLALLVFGAMAVAACGDGGDQGDEMAVRGQVEQFEPGTTMAELQDKGEIKIGVKYDVPPFGYLNPRTGRVEGFDVDLGKAIAEKLGVEPKFVEATSDDRIPLLRAGKIDLILSTMTITRERDREIDFSEPYYIAHGRVLAPRNSRISGIEDLGHGDRVCTARGSTYADTLRNDAPDAHLRLVRSYSECLELLQSKAVDAISTDDVILTGMIAQDDSLRLVGPDITTEPYGAGIKDGDTEFKQFVDEAIAEFKTDGRWDHAYQKWVGEYIPDREEQPAPTMTLQKALEIAPD